MIRERAPAKVNLVLRVGRVMPNGLHEVCSLLASLELHDVVEVREAAVDSVVCPGVDGPNLAAAAIAAFRAQHELPPLEVRIEKRIPVAAGLAGGSADAAAALRAANEIAGQPFDVAELRAIAAPLGSDLPSQVEPAHAVVSGTGERVARVELPEMALVLAPAPVGLSTAEVFRELDRLGLAREEVRCDDMREIAHRDVSGLAAGLENDLQRAALSLRPELAATLERVGGLGAQVSGSGPTVFAVFAQRDEAEQAAAAIPAAFVTMVAPG